jgi:hypothetical protein
MRQTEGSSHTCAGMGQPERFWCASSAQRLERFGEARLETAWV